MMEIKAPQLRFEGAKNLYRSLGWEVIPLVPGSKKPLIKWAEPTNPVEVDEVFKQHPNANIAVALGSRSKSLACQDFEAETDYLTYYGLNHEKLEKVTLVYTTPHNGIHVLAYSTNSFTKMVRVCEEHPLDVLGDGCLTTLPPSVIDGRRYEALGSWQVDLEPDENLLQSTIGRASQLGWKVKHSRSRFPVDQILRGVASGSRNESAFKYARYLVFTVGLDPGAAEYELKRWNQSNKPPLPDQEIVSVFKSAMSYAPQRRIKPNATWSYGR